MKILLAGDTHGNIRHIKYLLEVAAENGCDRIFQLGDFGAWEHMPSGVRYMDAVEEHAAEHGIPVYWLDGNHDKTSLVLEKYEGQDDDEGFLLCRPHVRYAERGHVWEWGGKTFIALGGAYSVDKDYRLAIEQHEGRGPGQQWFPEEEMTDRQLRVALMKAPATVDYMLTHDKPRASKPGWNRKDIPECWPNQNRIQDAVESLRPKMLFHGHLHYRYEDTIRHDGGDTIVHGLDADPSTAQRFYRIENSWEILDTEHEQ